MPVHTYNSKIRSVTHGEFHSFTYIYLWCRVNVIGIIPSLRRGRSGVEFRQGQAIFVFSSSSIPALGPTQPSFQWVPGLIPGIKLPERDADHSHLVPRLWMSGAVPRLPLLAVKAWTETASRFYLFRVYLSMQLLAETSNRSGPRRHNRFCGLVRGPYV